MAGSRQTASCEHLLAKLAQLNQGQQNLAPLGVRWQGNAHEPPIQLIGPPKSFEKELVCSKWDEVWPAHYNYQPSCQSDNLHDAPLQLQATAVCNQNVKPEEKL